jgi:hypothetical protein
MFPPLCDLLSTTASTCALSDAPVRFNPLLTRDHQILIRNISKKSKISYVYLSNERRV